MDQLRAPRVHKTMDAVGAAASFLCAIHCAVLPFVVTLLPLWGLGFLAGAATEWGLLLLAATFAVVSLGFGYRKHRSIRVLALATGALGFLFMGRFAEHQEWGARAAALGVAGGLVLVAAHWMNFRLCRGCKKCQSRDAASG